MKPLAERYSGSRAQRYEASRSGSAKWRAEQAAVRGALATLPHGAAVLDCPVGTGRFLPLYREMELHVVGVDASEDMLAEARAKGEPGRLLHGDVFDLPLDTEADAAVCVRLLNWLSPTDVTRALASLARAVRCGGPIWAGVRTTGHTVERGPGRIWHHGAADFAARVREAGLVSEHAHILDRGPGVYALHTLVPREAE